VDLTCRYAQHRAGDDPSNSKHDGLYCWCWRWSCNEMSEGWKLMLSRDDIRNRPMNSGVWWLILSYRFLSRHFAPPSHRRNRHHLHSCQTCQRCLKPNLVVQTRYNWELISPCSDYLGLTNLAMLPLNVLCNCLKDWNECTGCILEWLESHKNLILFT
jgi:hypothetical protein